MGRRGRHAAIDPLWRRAPTVLFRLPALFAAVAFGAMLLAGALAAYPLFMSATTSELVDAAIGRPTIGRYAGGMTYRSAGLPIGRGDAGATPRYERLDAAFRAVSSESPVLGEPVAALLDQGIITVSGSTPGQTRPARLFAAADVLSHVRVVERADTPGVWVPDLIANAVGIEAGDEMTLHDRDGATTRVRVAGVYEGVYQRDRFTGYWLEWDDAFALECLECAPPPQPIIGDLDHILQLERRLGHDRGTFVWQAPLSGPITLEEARALSRYVDDVRERMSDEATSLGRLFGCCHEFFFLGRGTSFTSAIDYVVGEATGRIAAVEGPARVLEIAAVAVALVVVGAAGVFSVRARRVESTWLFARGSSAWLVAGKSAVEALGPCLLGGAVGFASAVAIVTTVGPEGAIDPSAVADALVAVVGAVAGAVLAITLAAAETHVRIVEPHGRRLARLLSAVPWELGLAGLAWLAWDRLRSEGAFVRDVGLDVLKPSLALVAFPFLFLAAFAFLGARVTRGAFRLLRRPTEAAPPAPYLAVRRLGQGGVLTVMLVAAGGLCLGTFVHAQIVSRSIQTTVDAKAGVFVGSTVAGKVNYETPLPESFPFPMTRAVRFSTGATLPGGRVLDLLAVDSRTLADAAYWQDGFADRPLADLARLLRAPTGDGLPAILAAGGGLDVHEVEITTANIPVDVVATARAFPGMYSLNPTLVVDEHVLLDDRDLPFNPLRGPRSSTELWVRGDPDAVREAFAAVEFPPAEIVTTAEVKDLAYIAAAIDTFVVVNALGLVAAALTLVGMLMYLQARQRAQVVSTALSERMGMRPSQHVRALALELGAMLLVAFAVGGSLAVIVAGLTVPLLDPIPVIPPGPLFVAPVATFAVAAAVLVLFVWGGAVVVARRGRTADLGQVMRVAE
jgi:putative ABC transport system permease protein